MLPAPLSFALPLAPNPVLPLLIGDAILILLYGGTMSYNSENDVSEILDNLNEIFGFPEHIFSVQYSSNMDLQAEEEMHILDQQPEG